MVRTSLGQFEGPSSAHNTYICPLQWRHHTPKACFSCELCARQGRVTDTLCGLRLDGQEHFQI